MIPSSVQTLIEIFRNELADLRFGDMDAQGLAQLASEVTSAADAVTSAQAALDDARAKLLERQETMSQHAQRALAYARIYAETNDPLRARLDAIALPRPVRRGKAEKTEEAPISSTGETQTAPRRGRPRKTETADAAE